MKKRIATGAMVLIFICCVGCFSTVPRNDEVIKEEYAIRISEGWRKALLEKNPTTTVRVLESYLGKYSDSMREKYHKRTQKLNDKAFQETAFVDDDGNFVQRTYVLNSMYVFRGEKLFLQIFEIIPLVLKKDDGRDRKGRNK